MQFLNKIDSPTDLKKLNIEEMTKLAQEIRKVLINVISKTGGHLAPNLGVVELTLALHKVFNTPNDKIVWDVGHQSYVHKIITGRRDIFTTLRQYGGLSGFPKRSESEHDAFGTGHSSTSISAALGMAVARDLNGDDYNVLAVIGDGALTGGMAIEALNNAGVLQKKIIVILNDNEMSISENVGALSEYLCRLRTDPTYSHLKNDVESLIKSIPSIGEHVANTVRRVKDTLKYFLAPGMLFEQLGFTYIGPVDGHNLEGLIDIMERAKKFDKPVLVHVITKKGKGYLPAETNPDKFHGTGAFEITTGEKIKAEGAPQTYTEVFGDTLIELAGKNPHIVAITAAMRDGTGLTKFFEQFPKRAFDVGIAEQHAVTMAAGLAANNMQPVVAIYSTFLQRSYDQVLHDVCMQNLPVVFCLDRAGLVGDDGYTHHGVFDYSYLRMMPGMTIMAPKDENELRHMLYTAFELKRPVAIRYPRGSGIGVDCKDELQLLPYAKSEELQEGRNLCIWAAGSMTASAVAVAKELQNFGIDAGVVNMRFIKPLDEELLLKCANKYHNLVVMEENVLAGGVGSEVLELLNKNNVLSDTRVLNLGVPDILVPHGDKKLLLRDIGLDVPGMTKHIAEWLGKENGGLVWQRNV